jgi:hypothetical protein
MTDPQPNKTHFDTTQPRLNKTPSLISTNHVRVHAAHDSEHDCYNNLHSAEVVHIPHES